MKNNKAGLLALIVLGIASLLMIFFVLPRISNDGKPIGDAINEAGNAVKNSVEMGSDKAGDILSDAAQETANIADKVGRLAASATQSIKDLTTLFADSKVPSDADFAAARKKVEASLKELTNIEIPETLDETTSRLITTARTAAERTTAFLRGLPDSAAAAAAQVRRLAGVFTGTDDGAAQQPQPAAPAADAAQSTSGAPTFDVLRVEPDGSAVVAGKAQPGSKLEILSNGKVIAQTTIDGSGDFAAVFDNPLPPGDHELVLRSTDASGKATQSEEVATVSVPNGKAGELLAMVSKPGEASRVLAMPEAATSALQPPQAAQPGQSATAAATTTPAPAAGTPAPSAAAAPLTSTVQVTAVEFEGSKIFVAGSAPAASSVRALVDDKEIGKSTTEASGHFVIEGNVDLSVGSHIITVEELNADGTVKVRVRVPFERPQTDQATVAMQAPSATPSAATTTAPSENQSTASDRAAFEKLRTDVAKAFGILSNLYKDQATPALDQAIAGRSAVVIGLKSLSEFRTAAGTEPSFTAFAGDIAAKARQLLTSVEAWPNDVAGIGKGIATLASRLADLNIIAPPAPAPQAPAGPQTFEQPPLAESQNSVIIRRGDTLWQISRRVYGQGVRYTTIYLANEDQIKNPDLIEPGQIFGVPEKALPNAEELHRKRLKSGS
ncbi:LysM peptidoglycan-binding domain-containing protein [Agrobacterium tumefaciens]|uniref:LysM peptidoglycan-binding domain-containing protein n=1 Tax=Agrobacterium tumefaciens TaxID=358 RepID=A0AA44F185_AGRTU|nr:LysM peptidoglycan-binding domain-containing protein [Agrobacterium tumefaciens]NSL22673.1 LysM peptidoglycan-binding domain-containing protein [Agrobacterium tumefaciens]NTB84294.1 LysM peptidoglycan-binding domain-containing protein [Agrobacterium tumefaciens]NTC17588.1 LysM peptidoglycan-binding domain-containing protein [Agrobacterium tumefaciens]NTC27214.1 LysM peptidoglycan-binding domain-containing protein [Agrobacterium tumefaciens]NTC56940.1 LysM peptidoglycan-binding domain-contai